MTPAERRLRAQLAANTRWSRETDRKAAGERGQNGLRARFAREIDPVGRLSDDELAKRVENALKAHMQRMQLRSSQARAARRAVRSAS